MRPQDRLPGPSQETGDDSLLRRAGRLAGWVARTGYTLGKRIPGADTAEHGARQLERAALAQLRRRLDQADDPYLTVLAQSNEERGSEPAPSNGQRDDTVAVVPARDGQIEPVRAAMADLLNRSIGYGRARAEEYLYAVIVRQLTPDEARILAALSDGSLYPVIDVAERTALGGVGQVVLRNASTVGKSAGVTLLDQVPGYLTRLLGLGLVDVGQQEPSLETQYEILLTDDTVRAAEAQVKRAKFIRRTLWISRLGDQFWRACDPAGR